MPRPRAAPVAHAGAGPRRTHAGRAHGRTAGGTGSGANRDPGLARTRRHRLTGRGSLRPGSSARPGHHGVQTWRTIRCKSSLASSRPCSMPSKAASPPSPSTALPRETRWT
ncbi:hypothetical protein G6F22_016197 [Rhizopus arrhizus]|nr:hypothetical protein G6F22_016197 [Rhizopus arrhizus]